MQHANNRDRIQFEIKIKASKLLLLSVYMTIQLTTHLENLKKKKKIILQVQLNEATLQ